MNTQEMMNALRRDPSLCDTLIDSLDTIASGRNAYEYGLPRRDHEDPLTQAMWHAVMRWVEDTASELTKDSEYARGRAAGLEEAKAACEEQRDSDPPRKGYEDYVDGYTDGVNECGYAIDALKGS